MYTYMYIGILPLEFPSHLPSHPKLPESYSRFPLAIYFTHGSVYVSVYLVTFKTTIKNIQSKCIGTNLETMEVTETLICAAAAKSLQSCPTLCNPIEGSPPGSADPGILPARVLEWVAISFSKILYIRFLKKVFCESLQRILETVFFLREKKDREIHHTSFFLSKPDTIQNIGNPSAQR